MAGEEKKTKERDEDPRMTRHVDQDQVRKRLQMAFVDPLYVDPETIPHGMEYRWVRDSIRGQIDPNRIPEMMAKGWTAVPSSRHPELCPPEMPWRKNEYSGFIFRTGLVLYERPEELGKIEQKRIDEENVKTMTTIPGADNFMNDGYAAMRVIKNETSFGN